MLKKHQPKTRNLITLLPLFLGLAGCQGSSNNNSTTTAIPVTPQGSWTQYSVSGLGGSNELGFINFMTANNNQLAIAGTNTSMQPALVVCKNGLSLCGNFTNSGLSNVQAISALEFDSNNNLYGTFDVPQNLTINPTRANVMKLPAATGTWLTFNSTNGVGLGLDISNLGTLSSSSFAIPLAGFGWSHYGTAFLYDTNDNNIAHSINYEAGSLSNIINDGLGKIYVAGIGYYDDVRPSDGSYVWTWNYKESDPHLAFNKIESSGIQFSTINGMTSNNAGSIYITGQDNLSVTHVWQYNGSKLQDLAFPGYTISSLSFMPSGNSGYIIVGGVDKDFNGQVWSYNLQIESWATLDIPSSSSVGVVTVDSSNNKLYVSGQDQRGITRIWTFFN